MHSDQHQLTPQQPWDTLCYMCQLQYRIVHIDADIIFSDYVEFFSAPQAAILDAAMVPMTMRCRYTGTYLLRVFNADGLERPASSSAAQQQQSNLGNASSASSRARNSAHGLFRPANRGSSALASAGAAAPSATTTTRRIHLPHSYHLPLFIPLYREPITRGISRVRTQTVTLRRML